ncbi:GNAT family N-acetyltransferase [Sulfitobacter sp. JB4-11]|uniref:GNAT family N-acetyltransferase n=1 Tax=Sulfitobacter rhodophyticola TaxID=3238304 RepID=UPI003517A8FA
MQIRNAEAADVPALAQIWHAGWHQGHAASAPPALTATRTLEEFVERLGCWWPTTQIMRAEDGEVAGFFTLDGDQLYQFYVASAYQGQGVAAALMVAAEAALAPRKAWLACAADNLRAARFYEKCGWVSQGVESYETETTVGPLTLDVLRFEKDLSGS